MMRLTRSLAILAIALLFAGGAARAAGTLSPVGAPEAPIEIRDHAVSVVINNGFARTEVTQTFFNPNPYPLEAVYAFPVPKSASLAEVTVRRGESVIEGEVVARERAEAIYESERAAGNDAGIATKQGYQRFEFAITPVLPEQPIELAFVYYQPIEIDTGIGRYVYPLEEGGTDTAADAFWSTNSSVVGGAFSIDIDLKSVWPIANVRVPGLEQVTTRKTESPEHYQLRIEEPSGSLDRDVVFYYKLADDLPGRVEVIPYRDDPSAPGTFMAIVTPGVDLAPLRGADYTFVLDTSGSMAGKLATLADGVSRSLQNLGADDRFRIITFGDNARELTRGYAPVNAESTAQALEAVAQLAPEGGTNLYDGIALALRGLDDERATSIVLVTDGVANVGVVEPRAFRELAARYDVRIFGFLMGNGANWPLMKTVADASGGFYAAVSNQDDIIGQILLAKSKMTSEAMHDAKLSIDGVRTWDVSGLEVGKIYRGEQLVLFGRYEKAGPATLELRARLTGEDKTYRTRFDFPEIDTENPELERLWALGVIEELEAAADVGLADPREVEDRVRTLGVENQIVTDQTAMLLLSDAAFAHHGVERRNRDRVDVERRAQAARATRPATNRRVDTAEPTFRRRAPSLGGGGALDPLLAALVTGLAACAVRTRRARRN